MLYQWTAEIYFNHFYYTKKMMLLGMFISKHIEWIRIRFL